jgi:hypothetical protein
MRQETAAAKRIQKARTTLLLDHPFFGTFLRRFLLVLLPRGFMRIRNFGFLANRRRASLLPLCFQLLADSVDISARTAPLAADHACSSTRWNCPVCGGSMRVVERFSAVQLLLRSPPLTHLCAA